MDDHYIIEKEYLEDFNKQYSKQVAKSRKYEILGKSILFAIFAEFIISIILFVSFGYTYIETMYIIIIGIEISSIIFSLAGVLFMCLFPTNKFMQITMWLLLFLQISIFIILLVREFTFVNKNNILLIIMIISCILKCLLSLALATSLRRYYKSLIILMRIKNKLNEQKIILENSGKLLKHNPNIILQNSQNLFSSISSKENQNLQILSNFNFNYNEKRSNHKNIGRIKDHLIFI